MYNIIINIINFIINIFKHKYAIEWMKEKTIF